MQQMASDDILTAVPHAGSKLFYGSDPNQFGELRLPKGHGPFPLIVNVHGGYWSAQYSLTHAGHFCAALSKKGFATWNVEYRRVGNPGGGWPGSFKDVVSAYRFAGQFGKKYKEVNCERIVVVGHSAGGQLALCLAAHEPSATRVVALAGVVDLHRAWELHLGYDAVQDFLGGAPSTVAEHYREADPMQLKITADQQLIHGLSDDLVPPELSRDYFKKKNKQHEKVHLHEIPGADHFDLINPHSAAWTTVLEVIEHLLA
jgi:acetyl esterase/lipase